MSLRLYGVPVPLDVARAEAPDGLFLFEDDGTPVRRWRPESRPRCWCGRPVPADSPCGCCCAEHDDVRSHA